jgi:hypothetical protein
VAVLLCITSAAHAQNANPTVHATRVATLHVDGALDEEIYSTVPALCGFVQVEPQLGAPATEKTEVWVAYDEENFYVSFRCWDTYPERRVATEMRRDGQKVFGGDDIAYFFIDTFHDRRNGFSFSINPLGGRNEGQVAGEQYLGDWNPIYTVATGRFNGGWTLEVALPFKSLRYGPGATQVWGFNALRTVRWKNEYSVLVPVPPWNGLSAARQAQFAADLVGIEVPSGAKNLEVKPYAVSSVTTDRLGSPVRRNDPDADGGIDVKYGVTQNVIADFTYNTDFAQVEADEQQVNLTRFSLFFPEKRDFFLENQGVFTFGGATTTAASDTPILFYSRRIGLDAGRPVKIDGGGRLTGRVGRSTFGALNIQTEGAGTALSRATNFSVVRMKRDVLRRSTVGLLYTGRSASQLGAGRNDMFGVDSQLNFFTFLTINSYWARTRTDALTAGDDSSYRGQLLYSGDRYGAQLEHVAVGRDFNPEVGFIRRADIHRSFGQLRFSPRPKSIRSVRKFSYTASLLYVENGAGRVENRQEDGEFAIELQNADRFAVTYSNIYEFVPRPFTIASSGRVVVAAGGYSYDNVTVGYNLGPQRNVAANFLMERGRFYGGHRTAISATRGRLSLAPQLSVEPTYSINWIDLPQASVTSHLAGSRVTYTMSPQMFASALVQYNSSTNNVSANARLRWEYLPGSELFVVYNDERDTRTAGFPGLTTRSFIVKVNRLFRF